MNNFIIDKIIKHFLILNNIDILTYTSQRDEMLKYTEFYRVFDQTLSWYDTKEGFDYWYDIQIKFILFLYSKLSTLKVLNEEELIEYGENLLNRKNIDRKDTENTLETYHILSKLVQEYNDNKSIS